MHYLEKAAMFGMLDFGRHVIADQTTVYADTHDMGGLSSEEQGNALRQDTFWLDREKKWART
jgi:hypothetical protein